VGSLIITVTGWCSPSVRRCQQTQRTGPALQPNHRPLPIPACGFAQSRKNPRPQQRHEMGPQSPNKAEPKGPTKRAMPPDSNSSSSLDAPMNRPDTAATRPRMGSGVTICTSVWAIRDGIRASRNLASFAGQKWKSMLYHWLRRSSPSWRAER
jgi:hypothetical protein